VNWGAPSGAINSTDAPWPRWKSWTLTAAVQYWLADPNTNYAALLWTRGEDLKGCDFSEHTNKPKVDVVCSNQPKTL